MGAHQLSIAKTAPADNIMCYNASEDKMTSNNKPGGVRQGEQVRKRIIPLLTLLLVIAISVVLFVLSQRYPETVNEFKNYGYLGVFLLSLASNATVILPVPGVLLFIPLLTILNPVLVALVGATGGVMGEITGYMAGYSGREMAQDMRLYKRVEGWMRRWGAWTIFVFAVAPFLLVDVAGIVAGALRFPLWKFLLVVWVGKSLKYVGLMLAGAWGWEAITSLRLTSPISVGVSAALATLVLLALALAIENWTWKRGR